MKFNNEIKKEISQIIINNDIENLKKYLNNLIYSENKYLFLDYENKKLHPGTNEYNIIKFIHWLEISETKKDKINLNKKLPYSVFKIGNSKLPFLNFSVLPGVTCPGAGACLKFCYSFKAWRYPGAFFGQCMNTILMINNFNIIESELKKILSRPKFKNMEKIDFRLYVDGDFRNFQDIINWMELFKRYPKLNSYGYSKSLNLFLQLHDENFKFPKNYILNLSTGGVYDSLHPILEKLHFVRGSFQALNISKKSKLKDIKKKINKKKVFLCPGLCGSCTKIGHACGNNTIFKNYSIVIPVH
tara:strand:+ start:158 stop:1060 length:903 start_codon:yes stop_codon:yes gene_type:complete